MNHSTQGRRNRIRGQELQREAVTLARKHGLEAFNRDRGGAQCPEGDIEIEGVYLGCKRRKTVPAFLVPEKQESGVVWRPERHEMLITITFEKWCSMKQAVKAWDSHICSPGDLEGHDEDTPF